METNNTSSKTLLQIIISLLVIIAVAIGAYYLGANRIPVDTIIVPAPTPVLTAQPSTPSENEGDSVMCTMDAKICPDGSAVGRSGPNCEFTPCPGEAN